MKTNTMLASIAIDGQKLKAAREAKGQSIAEMATSLTLSREQIKFIEEGGDKPFYTPAHKLLAVRKYATALGIAYDDVVIGEGADLTLAAPEDAPAAVHVASQPALAAELRLAAVTHNAQIRRRTIIGLGMLLVLLALYAKVRGNDDDTDLQEQHADMVGMAVTDNQPEPAAAAANTTAANTAAANAVAAAPVSAAATATAKAVLNDTTRLAANANPGDCPAEQKDAELKTWSPAYQRKSDARLYIISPKGGALCVTDVSGHPKRYTLKPMAGQIVSGKPPYTVRADNLSQIEMYLQGLRVKVPTQTNALRLTPTRNTSPLPAEQTATAGPEA